MFHSARWKAYLKNLHSDDNGDGVGDKGDGGHKNIYHLFHSQKLWFTRDEVSLHNRIAQEHLRRCDALLEDCTAMVEALEETLANTPKPSEVLDWYNLW